MVLHHQLGHGGHQLGHGGSMPSPPTSHFASPHHSQKVNQGGCVGSHTRKNKHSLGVIHKVKECETIKKIGGSGGLYSWA